MKYSISLLEQHLDSEEEKIPAEKNSTKNRCVRK